MKSYKDPGLHERLGRAADAKQKALDQLRAKPPIDEAILAERRAARVAREAAEAEKRVAGQVAKQQAQAEKAVRAAEAIAREQAREVRTILTEAERKTARDLRYAARKGRK